MPQALRKLYPLLDLERAQDQVREALRLAFEECGGQVRFHERLNERLRADGKPEITKQAVSWWLSEGTFVDHRFWPHIETITDFAVTRRQLRPDIYGIAE